MSSKEPIDPRSTGRKRGRLVLFREGQEYVCAGTEEVTCGKTSKRLPPDAPIIIAWPESNRVLESSLQVNHINKNVLDNDPANLEWLCASCHKLKDSQSSKGVSIIEDEFGYGDYYE